MAIDGATERRVRVCDDMVRVATCPDEPRRVQVCDTTDPIAAVMRARIRIPYSGLVSIVHRACGTVQSGYVAFSPLAELISNTIANRTYAVARPLRCVGQPPSGNVDTTCDFLTEQTTVDCETEIGRNEDQQIISITFIAKWEVAFHKRLELLSGPASIGAEQCHYCPDDPPSLEIDQSEFVWSHSSVAAPTTVPPDDPTRFTLGGQATARLHFPITPQDAPPPPIPFEFFSALIQAGGGELSIQCNIPETNPTGYTVGGVASGVFGGTVPYSRSYIEFLTPQFVTGRAILNAPLNLPGKECSFVDCSNPLYDCCFERDGVCLFRTVFLDVRRTCIGDPCTPDPPVNTTIEQEVLSVDFFP